MSILPIKYFLFSIECFPDRKLISDVYFKGAVEPRFAGRERRKQIIWQTERNDLRKRKVGKIPNGKWFIKEAEHAGKEYELDEINRWLDTTIQEQRTSEKEKREGKILELGEQNGWDKDLVRRKIERERDEPNIPCFLPLTELVPLYIGVAKISDDFRLQDIAIISGLDREVTPDAEGDFFFNPHLLCEKFWMGWRKYHNPTLVSFCGERFDLPLLMQAAFKFGIDSQDWLPFYGVDLSARPAFQSKNRSENRLNFYGRKNHLPPQADIENSFHVDISKILSNFGAVPFTMGSMICNEMLSIEASGNRSNNKLDENEFEKENSKEVNDEAEDHFEQGDVAFSSYQASSFRVKINYAKMIENYFDDHDFHRIENCLIIRILNRYRVFLRLLRILDKISEKTERELASLFITWVKQNAELNGSNAYAFRKHIEKWQQIQ